MLSVLALFLAAAASAATIPINGLVVNKEKEPMVGVTVLLKGTSQGVTTDAEGRFFIDVPDKKSVLSFGFVGYQTQEIVVGSRINLHVILEEQVSELDEVVVVGYGTQKKLSVVGAVESPCPEGPADRHQPLAEQQPRGTALGRDRRAAHGRAGQG